MNSNILLNGKKTKTWSIAFGILGVLSGILVAFFLHKALSRPIKELILVSGKVADGDLSIEIDRTGSDEIVVLSRAINTMVNNLQRIVKEIKTAYIEVESTAHSLNKHSVEASKGAELQGLEINKVASSVNEMNSIFKDISSNVKTLTSSLDQSSSSTYEMSTAIKNVFSMADRIAKEIETISSSQLQMNTNMGQTVEFLNTLSTTSQQMTNTVKDLTASINKVGQHAEKSKSLAEGVTRMAREQGVSAVEDVVNITRKNKQLVDNYSQLIYSLGKRSTSIGKILDVIRGIVDQTNLLSLNASIIAAQAGEHGRSFAVVADEIRTLSDTTTTNVKQIEEVIKGVSSEVDEAVKLIQEVKEGADSSISLAVQAGKTLQEIDDISNQSTQMAREIADAVDIQVSHSDNILDVVTNNTQEVMVAKKAVDEQKRGNDLIVASVKELTSIAGKLKNSTEEQADGSDIISKTITEMHEFSQEIMMAMDEEQRTSQYVVESLDRISEVANNNLSAMESLATMVNELGALANKLGPEVSKFKLPIHYEKEDGLAIEPFNKKTEPVMPQALHPSTENTL